MRLIKKTCVCLDDILSRSRYLSYNNIQILPGGGIDLSERRRMATKERGRTSWWRGDCHHVPWCRPRTGFGRRVSLIRSMGQLSIHPRTDPCVDVCAPAPLSRNLKVTPSRKFLSFLEVVLCIHIFIKLERKTRETSRRPFGNATGRRKATPNASSTHRNRLPNSFVIL